jgi:O-Antigen ligase
MKELVVILPIAAATFWLAKPFALKFCTPEEFRRRRNVWLALTTIAFLSPNFWIFVAFAAPVYIWIGRKDANPAAAYLLLMHVVPPVPIAIPAIGTLQIFELDNYRLLAFCLLIPVALRARGMADHGQTGDRRTTDRLLLAFGAMQIIVFVPPVLADQTILQDSLTHFLRRTCLWFVDIFALYYAFSRSCNNQRKIVDALAAFCLASGIMAFIAAFEHFKGWLLYTALATRWNPADTNYQMAWIVRGDSWLRSQASAGHTLCLAFLLAIAFGFWLHLQSYAATLRARAATAAAYWLGIIATFGRGPAIGAILIYVFNLALKPRAMARLLKGACLIAVALGILSLTPAGEQIMNSLPFITGQADENVSYRQRLLSRSLELIQTHPWFGDPLAVQQMRDLRQGQGIIDIVNAYVGVALFSGCVGLALFIGVIWSSSAGVLRAARAAFPINPDRGLLGFNLVACTLGMLFILADTSMLYGVEKMFYVLIALSVAYASRRVQMASAAAWQLGMTGPPKSGNG